MKESIQSWIVSISSVGALLLAFGSKITHDALFSVMVSGIVIMVVAGEVMIGHVLGINYLYTWIGRPPGMAFETAALFMIIGAGKITMASKLRRLTKRGRF